MPAKRLPALLQLQFSFEADEEPEPMNTPPDCIPLVDFAAIPTMLDSASSVSLVSNAAALPESLPASCAAAQLNAPGERGSVAALMQCHAEKQAQGIAPLTKPDKLPKSADDSPISLLAYALREVSADKLLQQAQEAGDFAAACRRIRQAAQCWGRDIAREAKEESRPLTGAEQKGIAFWQCEARQAETALRIFEAVGKDTRAACDALDNADLERFAAALRTGCYVALGL